MVRKRDAWTRAQDRLRRRRKRKIPQTGWLLSELSALTALPSRTIRYYVEQGVLARPEFRGTATRYGREHLLRLLGIERLKREGMKRLASIKQHLDAAGEAQLLAAVAARPPSAMVAAALGITTPSASSDGSASTGQTSTAGAGNTSRGELWRRLSLLPGLELLLAEDASPAVRQIAQQIQVHCSRSGS